VTVESMPRQEGNQMHTILSQRTDKSARRQQQGGGERRAPAAAAPEPAGTAPDEQS
jgi:hypothetical protein